MALHLLERNRDGARSLSRSLAAAMDGIQHCECCRMFSEEALCNFCASARRDAALVCVVETPADVIAIEQNTDYRGHYFVLMGHLSPIDGIGPDELGFELLTRRLDSGEVSEIIIATGSTVEGEATAHYIGELARSREIGVSRIAHGVPLGGDLEYVDGGTLAHALAGRQPLS